MKIRLLALLALLLAASNAFAANNAVVVTVGSGLTMCSKDIGAGVQAMCQILVDTSGVPLYGTAGSANSNVLTIQGISGGTAVPISGTLTANQGTANATPWNVSVTNTNANGQTTMSGSSPVVLPNNMAAIALWGQGATAATTPTSATAGGCNGVNAFPAAVTNGQMVVPNCGLEGTSIVRLFAPKEVSLNGEIASAMTGTSSTAVAGMGAQGGSTRVYVTACTFSNSHATQGTVILLQDGSGGTTLWQAPAAPAFGGAAVTFPTPIKTTANTGLFAQNVTTGSNTFVSCTGYAGL